MISQQCQGGQQKFLPKRIILVRHGESQGNLDGTAYATTPDYKIPLTEQGLSQAQLSGSKIRQVISGNGEFKNWKVYFYVSPYDRTRSTLKEIGRSFPKRRVIGVREECRIREQDFGNFQVAERMKAIKETRERFGRFFYRFPEGESAADVFDRVSTSMLNFPIREIVRTKAMGEDFFPSMPMSLFATIWDGSKWATHRGFLESLWRDIDMNRLHCDPDDELNLIIVSHGLASRVFLMKWFKWTVEQFEYLNNFGNCEFRVMQLGDGGEYSLAVHHTDEEMKEWGLSPEMIEDQKWRSRACRGSWNEKCSWYLDSFFDHLADSDDGSEEVEEDVSSTDCGS